VSDEMEMSFEKKKDFIYFKISGKYSKEDDFDRIKDLFFISKRNGYSKILADVRDLEYNFDTYTRFDLSKYWLKLLNDIHFISTAVLGNKEVLNKFSENFIVNRGGKFKQFTDEKEAIDWLKNECNY
jgi:hypothetical protein